MTLMTKDLRTPWRLGTTYDEDFSFVIPAIDDDEPRAPAAVLKAAEDPLSAITPVPGAVPLVNFHVLATQAVGITEQPYSDIYLRIWVVPPAITVMNPDIGIPIPFKIWSAWTVGNTLNSITPVGATGLTLSISAPLAFLPVEEKDVTVTIGATAPAIIDARWTFSFSLGSGTFDLDALLLDWVRLLPEEPITETWEWLTHVLVSRDSTEQRLAGRRQPRRRLEFGILIDEDDRRVEYKRLYGFLADDLVVPFWQYDTVITQTTAVSGTKIFFNREGTDFRDGDLAVILRPSTGESYLLRTTTIDADGANLVSPLTVEIRAGDEVAPAFASVRDNGSALAMKSVHGRVDFALNISEFRSQFDRPTSAAVITTFDGFRVLDRTPIVTRNEADESFDVNPVDVDSVVGVFERTSSWLHAMVSGGRQFYIPRRMNPTEMDFWRDFLTEVVGMREPWLLPTWWEDLVLETNPIQGALQFFTDDAVYATDYFPHETYKRLMLTSPSGAIIYRKVDVAEAQPDGTCLITLTTSLPNTADWANGFEISFLNLVRLGSDTVRITHFSLYSILDLVVRSIDG